MSTELREWHKSWHSGAQGDCVEVAEGQMTWIRDTQNRTLGYLDVPATEWTALLSALRKS
ncbi:DUF397 domain-containing protein [Nocardiopsis alba]|uniref:DUF397 domain-containing protein n=1 Tax=Nocardiopsis alba TaxID=53437 RepID=A0ABV5DQF8_9ACTN